MSHGQRLIELCGDAQRSVLIVAPFIKEHAIQRILDAIPARVDDVTCITRWTPEEIAAGVSDLEVLDSVRRRQGAQLLLRPWLHGKLFRVDRRCLVGSTNVTGRALGWVVPSNLELMLEVDAEHPDVIAFERELSNATIKADDVIREAMRAAAERLEFRGPTHADEITQAEKMERWFPACATPDRLWNVYAQYEMWRLVGSAIEAAALDLLVLNIPPGMTRSVFERYVGAILSGLPVVQEIDRHSGSGLSNHEGVALLRRLAAGATPPPYDLAEMWEVVKAWLEYFRPDAYRRAASSEILIRGRNLA